MSKKTQPACKESQTDLIFSRSKLAQGRAPRIFDDLLMMYHTEKLETDTNRNEKSAKYTPRGAAIQTAYHHPETRKSPEFQGIPGQSDLPPGKSLAGAEGFEPSARGFGVDVGKALADIYQPVFRTVEPFVFPEPAAQKDLMVY